MFEGVLVCWSAIFVWQEMFWGAHAGGAATGYEERLDVLGRHGGFLLPSLRRGRRCFLIAILVPAASFILHSINSVIARRGSHSKAPSKFAQKLGERPGSKGAPSGAP